MSENVIVNFTKSTI